MPQVIRISSVIHVRRARSRSAGDEGAAKVSRVSASCGVVFRRRKRRVQRMVLINLHGQ